jgi:hypothetical protein
MPFLDASSCVKEWIDGSTILIPNRTLRSRACRGARCRRRWCGCGRRFDSALAVVRSVLAAVLVLGTIFAAERIVGTVRAAPLASSTVLAAVRIVTAIFAAERTLSTARAAVLVIGTVGTAEWTGTAICAVLVGMKIMIIKFGVIIIIIILILFLI